LNVTSEVSGVGGGVLLRAIEPLEGMDEMAAGACGVVKEYCVSRARCSPLNSMMLAV
jgi:3-methyladenine DNA glycosylase Mpg